MFTFLCFGLFCKMMIFLIWEVFLENQFLQHVYYHVYNHSPKFYIFLNLFDIFKQGFKISSKTDFSGNVSFRSTGTIDRSFDHSSVFFQSIVGRPVRSTESSNRSTDRISGRPTMVQNVFFVFLLSSVDRRNFRSTDNIAVGY